MALTYKDGIFYQDGVPLPQTSPYYSMKNKGVDPVAMQNTPAPYGYDPYSEQPLPAPAPYIPPLPTPPLPTPPLPTPPLPTPPLPTPPFQYPVPAPAPYIPLPTEDTGLSSTVFRTPSSINDTGWLNQTTNYIPGTDTISSQKSNYPNDISSLTQSTPAPAPYIPPTQGGVPYTYPTSIDYSATSGAAPQETDLQKFIKLQATLPSVNDPNYLSELAKAGASLGGSPITPAAPAASVPTIPANVQSYQPAPYGYDPYSEQPLPAPVSPLNEFGDAPATPVPETPYTGPVGPGLPEGKIPPPTAVQRLIKPQIGDTAYLGDKKVIWNGEVWTRLDTAPPTAPPTTEPTVTQPYTYPPKPVADPYADQLRNLLLALQGMTTQAQGTTENYLPSTGVSELSQALQNRGMQLVNQPSGYTSEEQKAIYDQAYNRFNLNQESDLQKLTNLFQQFGWNTGAPELGGQAMGSLNEYFRNRGLSLADLTAQLTEQMSNRRASDQAANLGQAGNINEQIYGQERGNFADTLSMMQFNSQEDQQKFTQMMDTMQYMSDEEQRNFLNQQGISDRETQNYWQGLSTQWNMMVQSQQLEDTGLQNLTDYYSQFEMTPADYADLLARNQGQQADILNTGVKSYNDQTSMYAPLFAAFALQNQNKTGTGTGGLTTDMLPKEGESFTDYVTRITKGTITPGTTEPGTTYDAEGNPIPETNESALVKGTKWVWNKLKGIGEMIGADGAVIAGEAALGTAAAYAWNEFAKAVTGQSGFGMFADFAKDITTGTNVSFGNLIKSAGQRYLDVLGAINPWKTQSAESQEREALNTNAAQMDKAVSLEPKYTEVTPVMDFVYSNKSYGLDGKYNVELDPVISILSDAIAGAIVNKDASILAPVVTGNTTDYSGNDIYNKVKTLAPSGRAKNVFDMMQQAYQIADSVVKGTYQPSTDFAAAVTRLNKLKTV